MEHPESSDHDVVLSDPYACLPIANDKNAGEMREIHLAGRGIQRLHNLQAFVSLDCLWLNNNRLTSLDGLEANFRLKLIYLHNNELVRLQPEGSLEQCTFLQNLTLNGNRLDDLDNVTAELRTLRHLHVLDLFDNPLAQEDNYRLRVIAALPTLHTLDRHDVTPEERVAAAALVLKMASLKNFQLTAKVARPPKFSPQETAQRSSSLLAAQQALGRAAALHRIILEPEFVALDPRRLGCLPAPLVWQVLGRCGLGDALSETDKGLILDTYARPTAVPALCSTGTLRKRLFDYRAFCRDVLPADLRRLPDATYVMEPCAEISVSVVSLESYVRAVKEKRAKEEEAARRAALRGASGTSSSTHGDGSSSSGGGEQGSVFSSALQGRRPKCEAQGLSPFLAAELGKIVKAARAEAGAAGGSGAGAGRVGRAQVERIVQHMAVFGVAPRDGLHAACDAVFGRGEGEGEGGGEVEWAALLDSLGVSVTSRGAGLVFWRPLTDAERRRLESRCALEAAQALDQVLRAGPRDDARAAAARAWEKGLGATRLQAGRAPPPLAQLPPSPARALALAPNRSDLIVIPNLLKDAATESRRREVLGASDWAGPLRQLGLRGELLTLAVERKNRSLLKADRLRTSASTGALPHTASTATATATTPTTANATNATNAGVGMGAGAGAGGRGGPKPRASLLPAPSMARGWAPSTATLTIGQV